MTLDDLRAAPRWFLVILSGTAVALLAAWASHVERHIQDSNAGYQRISALEARVQALEAHRAWCMAQHRAANGGS